MEVSDPLEATESPRSTVVPASETPGLITKTTIMTPGGGQAEDGAPELQAAQPNSGDGEHNGRGGDNDNSVGNKESPPSEQGRESGDKKEEGGLSPTPQQHSYLQGYPPHLTPQPGAGYYLGYGQSQVTPEPPSPAGPGAAVYDMGSFFQQPAAFAHNSPFGVPQTPLSPRRSGGMGGIPPASPLFPRVSTAAGAAGLVPGGGGIEQRPGGAPPSPNVPYLSPALGANTMYHQTYPGNGMGNHGDSPDDIPGWGDRYVNLKTKYVLFKGIVFFY